MLKRAIAVLGILAGSSVALAQTPDKWPTMIPARSAIPVVVVSPGSHTTVNVVKDFAGTQDEAVGLTKVDPLAIDDLVKRQCRITLEVAHSEDMKDTYYGNYYSQGQAAIFCTESDGSISRAFLDGHLVGESGEVGIERLEPGVKGYFVTIKRGGI